MPGVLLPRKVVRNTHKIRSVTGYIVTSNYPGSSCPLIFDSRNFMRVRTCEVHTANSRKGIPKKVQRERNLHKLLAAGRMIELMD